MNVESYLGEDLVALVDDKTSYFDDVDDDDDGDDDDDDVSGSTC